MPASKICFVSYLFTVFTVGLSPAHLPALLQKTVGLQDGLCIAHSQAPGPGQVIGYQDDLLPGWMAEHWPVFRQHAK